MLYVMVRFNARANPEPSKTTHNTLVEVIWTVVPIVFWWSLPFRHSVCFIFSAIFPKPT